MRLDHTAGLSRLFTRPALTVDAAAVQRAPEPSGLRVTRVVDAAGLAAMAQVETEAFGTDPEVAAGLFSIGMVRDGATRPFLGTMDGDPVAEAIANVWLHPTSGARTMYERLGFREVARWDVWTRPGTDAHRAVPGAQA